MSYKKGKLLISLLLISCFAFGQEVEHKVESRTSVELSLALSEKFDINFAPEIRYDESFSLDKYILEAGADYKLFENVSIGAIYRFGINPKNNKDTEYYQRFSLNLTGKKEFNDFKTSLRLRYSNESDDDTDYSSDKEKFMRYKAAIKYNIPKCKVTPLVAAEIFQQLSGNGLHKMRYTAGASYKINKKNSLVFRYKLDYFINEYTNKHILSLAYKIKL